MRAGLLLAVACGVSSSAPAALAADAKAECLAAADQGQLLRDDGKYTRAHDAFVTCSRDVCPKVVTQLCVQWLRQVDDSMPTVVAGAKDEAGADLTSAHVTIDGQPLTDVLDGRPQPVDPGEHTVRFTRPGFGPAEMHVVVRAGEKNRAVMVTLRAAPGESALAPPPEEMPAPKDTRHASIFTARNVTAAALAVLGAGALVGGGYFMAQSSRESNTASGLRGGIPPDYCTLSPSDSTCVQLQNAVDAQHRDTTLGVSMLVGGGVVLVGAAVLWFAWPTAGGEKAHVRLIPEVSPGRAVLGASGFF
jgi:hypothetical protein